VWSILPVRNPLPRGLNGTRPIPSFSSMSPLQRCLGHLADVRRMAVETGLFAVLELEAALGRNGDLLMHGRQRFADQFFVDEGSVHLGRIEKRHAAFKGRPNDRHPSSRVAAGR